MSCAALILDVSMGTWFPHGHGTPLGVVFLCAWSLNDMCKVSLTVPRVVCLGEAVGWVGGRGRFGGGGVLMGGEGGVIGRPF